jgi:ubiquinone/menaquinone biosynthesis C-methylase UbiE
MAAEAGPAEPDYGNWASWKILLAFAVAAAVLFFLSSFLVYFLIAAVALLAEFAFLAYGRYALSPRGGNRQAKLWDVLIQHLEWDGDGRVIDIGCGSGALAIRLAKKYPSARVVGLDYWGKMWEYSETMCEQNARIEKVADRVSFQKGDAAKLPFEDEYFDAAVSNDTFHNVRSVKDKRDSLREALRIVRKGGSFAFQDGFTMKMYYHSEIEDLLNTIRNWGVQKVSWKKTLEQRHTPKPLRTTMVVIWGQK